MNDCLPALIIKATSREDAQRTSPVINKDSIEYFLWVELDSDKYGDCKVYQLDEVTYKGCEEIPSSRWSRQGSKWVRCISELLNTDVGLHTYRLSLATVLDDVIYLYFAYRIQDSNPAKPYVYMNREQSCGSCCTCLDPEITIV